MLPSKEILQFIPQRQPVVMIDVLLENNDNVTVSELLVREDNIFFENGFLNESGLTENIAQTAAARAGYECMKQNIPVPVGYIAAIKALKIHRLPTLHSMIKTQIEITNKIFDITIIKGTVTFDNNVIAECEMRILAVNDDQKT